MRREASLRSSELHAGDTNSPRSVQLDRLEKTRDELVRPFEVDRFDRVDDRLDRMQRFYVGTTVWSMTALTGIFALVVTFFG